MVAEQHIGTMTGALMILAEKGLRYGGAIDIGCADGHFNLLHWEAGILKGSTFLNVDARALYADSLEEIRATLGGHYRICAVADREGTIAMTQSAHPYWDSARAPGDPYWQRVNDLSGQTVEVPARTIDALVAETALPGPYLLKLDVQGSELAALRGAAKTLADTDAIVVETDVDDFTPIHGHVVAAGFDLFDVTNLGRGVDQALYSFYPVYLNRRRRGLIDRRLWAKSDDAAMIRQMTERRGKIRGIIAQVLAKAKAAGVKRS